jgi:heme-degrading monooxygenase HmoA
LPGGRGGWHDDGVEYLLAQVNIARMREPLDSPLLAGFVAALDPVNALADAAPGFVWRMQTEDGNATAVRAFEWDQAGSAGVLVNMSVWESVETLAAYVYSDAHREVMRQRRSWFERMATAHTALWWVPRGPTPTTGEAEERVIHLRVYGPTVHAFTLREHFPPPGAAASGPVSSPEEWNCPA